MAIHILPRVLRGQLFWFVGDVGFGTLREAMTAWSAAEARRLDLIETQVQS